MTQSHSVETQDESVSISANSLMRLRHAARQLVIGSHLQSRSSVAGAKQSRFRGRGMDYVESRRYLPGDDIRTMDWRVTARSGHPHTKIFQEERERSIFIAVDLSESMHFGTRVAFKSVVAAKVAALLGWVAVNRGDRFGIGLLNQNEVKTLPMKGGPRAMSAFTRLLSQATQRENLSDNFDSHNESFETLLREAALKAPAGCNVFVVSDFSQLGVAETVSNDASQLSLVDTNLRQLRRHRSVAAVRVLDRLELNAPAPGRYAITDGTLHSQLETRNARTRSAIQHRLLNKNEAARAKLGKAGLSIVDILTDDDLTKTLRQQLAGKTSTNGGVSNDAALPLASGI